MFDISRIPETYTVISSEYIEETASDALLLKHKKTGARVAVLANTDENKVFSIAFRTPPADSTGVAHIMEHSVLCGSEQFPAKDPFKELMKGSLNTFLNAMTYPDKTVYPIASCNDADFQNLMHVYLDAVFHPNIYVHDEIFRQEGWHYEMENAQDPLTINGVVYNEMKGAFSSPDDLLARKISDTLYPDTVYSVESGGDPDVIPQLTYDRFLDFHRKYYHPSNCYIYLYGNMDVTEKLSFIDEKYLNHYDRITVPSEIGLQKPFNRPVEQAAYYPVADEESAENAAYMAVNWVLEDMQDLSKTIAFQILEYVLMEAPGAPLKQALLDQDCGEDIYGTLETSMQQPYLSIVIKNMDPEGKARIRQLIHDTLAGIVREGLNRKTLEGVLSSFEFKSRESDYGQWPKGLMYGLQMMDTWLYDEHAPFTLLKYQEAYNFLREQLNTDYFEQLIRESMIENPHASVLMLLPDPGLTAKNEALLAEKLAKLKAEMSAAEVQEIIDRTLQLRSYQSEPTPQEIMEMIPMLSISDLKKTSDPLINIEKPAGDIRRLYHEIETNGINYVRFMFDIRHIDADELPLVGILTEALGNMNTKQHSYQELTDEINLASGGVRTFTEIFTRKGSDEYQPFFTVTVRCLFEKTARSFELAEEMLMDTCFDDTRRLKDILNQLKSRLEMSFMTAGHSLAIGRAASYARSGSWFRELTEGISFYQEVCSLLKDYDTKSDVLPEKLRRLCSKIFRKEFLLTDWTSDLKGLTAGEASLKAFSAGLSAEDMTDEEKTVRSIGTCPTKNEAFMTPGMVQYNGCVGDFIQEGFAYHGGMNVLQNILGSEYLWNLIREKGGAYGCMCGMSENGSGYFVSYRDPKLDETYAAYETVPDYIRSMELDDRELTKYIIGAIGKADRPMTPYTKGVRSLTAFLGGYTESDLQKRRDELLGTDVMTLRSFADAVKAVLDSGWFCSVGSESAIKASEKPFEHITQLLR